MNSEQQRQNEARVLLVAGSPEVDWARFEGERARCGVVVGVDGGAVALLGRGVVPDYVTGDFDTATPEDLTRLKEAGAEIVPTPDQEFTDLDKALEFAFGTLGAGEVLVFGATGGRLDHTYSALSTVVKHGARGALRLVDGYGETRLVCGELVLEGAGLPGRVLSLLAFGEGSGIRTTGVRWPLNGETLKPGVRDGTLNVITEPRVTVSCESGDLLVFVSWGKTSPPSPLLTGEG